MKLIIICLLAALVSCKGQPGLEQALNGASKKEYFAVEEYGNIKSKHDSNSHHKTVGTNINYDCTVNKCRIEGYIFKKDTSMTTETRLLTADLDYIGNGYYQGVVFTEFSGTYTVKFSPQRGHFKFSRGLGCSENNSRIGAMEFDEWYSSLGIKLQHSEVHLTSGDSYFCEFEE